MLSSFKGELLLGLKEGSGEKGCGAESDALTASRHHLIQALHLLPLLFIHTQHLSCCSIWKVLFFRTCGKVL